MVAGGCLCGAVRFAVEAFQGGAFKCHCSKCRKAFGGAGSAAALVARDDFRWLAGEGTVRAYHCASGFTRCFCPDCGCIVPQHIVDHGLQWVPLGLLDADPGIRLKHHIHVDSKAAWEILDDQALQHAAGFDS
ncbi:MAG: GFA family protein [Halioglobus sp.]|nr:GFA family protein [Halioglobus sp.]